MDWIRVANLNDIPHDTGLEVMAGQYVVALFREGDQVYALDGICPHAGGPLAQGTVAAGIVTCPWHGWQFDVCTGQHQLSPRIVQPRFEVRVEGEWILLNLE